METSEIRSGILQILDKILNTDKAESPGGQSYTSRYPFHEVSHLSIIEFYSGKEAKVNMKKINKEQIESMDILSFYTLSSLVLCVDTSTHNWIAQSLSKANYLELHQFKAIVNFSKQKFHEKELDQDHVGLKLLLQILGLKNLLWLLSLVMLEQPIILASSCPYTRTLAVEALVAQLKPFQWPHPIFVNIPSTLCGVFGEFMGEVSQTYLLSIHPSNVVHFVIGSQCSRHLRSVPTVVNLDSNWIQPGPDAYDVPGLPYPFISCISELLELTENTNGMQFSSIKNCNYGLSGDMNSISVRKTKKETILNNCILSIKIWLLRYFQISVDDYKDQYVTRNLISRFETNRDHFEHFLCAFSKTEILKLFFTSFKTCLFLSKIDCYMSKYTSLYRELLTSTFSANGWICVTGLFFKKNTCDLLCRNPIKSQKAPFHKSSIHVINAEKIIFCCPSIPSFKAKLFWQRNQAF